MTRIIIAEGQVIVRKGLLYHCRILFGYQDVDEVSDGNHLMEALKRKAYTHLILDLVLSDGTTLDTVGIIRTLYPRLNILIFTAKSKAIYGPALGKYGIRHFVEKDAAEGDTIRKLRSFLISTVSDNEDVPLCPVESAFARLTRRETEVLHYWLEGLTTRETALRLNTSDQTISTFKNRIREKTNTRGVKDLEELVIAHKYKT